MGKAKMYGMEQRGANTKGYPDKHWQRKRQRQRNREQTTKPSTVAGQIVKKEAQEDAV